MISFDRMTHQLSVARDLVEQAQSRGTYSEQNCKTCSYWVICMILATNLRPILMITRQLVVKFSNVLVSPIGLKLLIMGILKVPIRRLSLICSIRLTCTLHQQENALHMLNVCKTLPIVMAKTRRAIRMHGRSSLILRAKGFNSQKQVRFEQSTRVTSCLLRARAIDATHAESVGLQPERIDVLLQVWRVAVC